MSKDTKPTADIIEPTEMNRIDPNSILIRPLSRPEDFHSLIQIWLDASIEAHHFIPESYWRSKAKDVCNIYLPTADTYIAIIEREIVGFYAYYQHRLAALFVEPKMQHRGIGSTLLEDAKNRFSPLEARVYKRNSDAVQFYLHHGFLIQKEEIDTETKEPELIITYNPRD